MRVFKLTTFIFTAALFSLFLYAESVSQADDPGIRFRAAIEKEEVDGDLQRAIDLYKDIISRYGEERALAAKAQLHIGLCYEKLGLQEAEKAFQNVLDNYPEQLDAVSLARQKISSLQTAKHAIERGNDDLVIQQLSSKFDPMGAPSPDGRYMSFVNWTKPCLALYEINTGKMTDIVSTTGTWEGDMKWAESSVWSPDNKQLAYVWYDESKDDQGREIPVAIRVTGIDGSDSRELFSDRSVSYPHPFGWTRDGQYVLAVFFYATQDQKIYQEIVLISASDGSVKKLARREKDMATAGVSLSPDGKYLAYSMNQDPDSPQNSIFVLALDDNSETVLSEHSATDFSPYWSYDGKYIIFFSDRTGSMGVWIQKMTDGKPIGEAKLIKNLNRVIPIGLTNDNDLYMAFVEGGSNIYSVDLDPLTGKIVSEPKYLVESNIGWNYASCFSLDGRYMAYVSKRGVLPWQVAWGQEHLIIRDLQTGEERDLIPQCKTLVDGAQDQPRWSPDGREILVNGRNKSGILGQYLIDVDNLHVSPVFKYSSVWMFEPIWSQDGNRYYFHRGGTESEKGIYVLNRAGGEERRLSSEKDVYEMRLRPDGKQLAIITPDAIKLVSTESGEIEKLVDLRDGSRYATLAWSPDGRYLYYRKPNNEKQTGEIWFVGVDDKEAHYSGIAVPFLRYLSVHPNGKQLVFTDFSVFNAGTAWVMKNFMPASEKE